MLWAFASKVAEKNLVCVCKLTPPVMGLSVLLVDAFR